MKTQDAVTGNKRMTHTHTMLPRRPAVLAACLAALMPLLAQATAPVASADALQRQAVAFNAAQLTLDNHLDIPFDLDTTAAAASHEGNSQFDLAKAARGGLKAAVVALFAPQGALDADGYRDAADKAEQKHRLLTALAASNPEQVVLVDSPAALQQAVREGRFAIVLQILNGSPIGTDLDQIDAWHARGVQVFGFTHAGNNALADSARPNLLLGRPQYLHHGLSALGRQAVGRLNDLGMVIDVSQVTGQAVDQVLALSRAPVIASHSNARAIIDHPRNLDDARLQAIAAGGGLVAINAYSSWVRPLPADAVARANAVRQQYGVPQEAVVAGLQPVSAQGVRALDADSFKRYSDDFHAITGDPAYRATLAEYVDQLEYVIGRIGIDHVGISSDFNHGGGVVGWEDVGESVNVTAELLRRGHSEQDIAKLWGGNFLRVWAQAQAAARPAAGG